MAHKLTTPCPKLLILKSTNMKTLVKITVFLVMFAGAWMAPEKTSAYNNYYYASYQIFYDELSPYGNWIYTPEYGYVWSPNVEAGFAPYATAGHWVFTFFGWTWVSDYPWGWAPFHYGRWFVDPYYGPMWIPGNEWGPAWVMWRRAPGYYGWAPMGPGYGYGYGYGHGHGYGHSYNVPDNNWVFVQNNYITNYNITNYYVDNSNNTTIINNSTVITDKFGDVKTNKVYLSGPAISEVQKVTGKTIKPVTIADNKTPGQKLAGNELALYKPDIKKDNGDGLKPSPKKVSDKSDLRKITNTGNTGNKANTNLSNGNKNNTYNKNSVQTSDKNNLNAKQNNVNNSVVNNNYSNNVKQQPVNNNVNRTTNNYNSSNKINEQKNIKPVNNNSNYESGQKVNTYNTGNGQKVNKQENNKVINNNVRTSQPPVKSSPDNNIQKSNSGTPSKTKVSGKKG